MPNTKYYKTKQTISRSAKLRNYGLVYDSIISNINTNKSLSKTRKKPKNTRKSSPTKISREKPKNTRKSSPTKISREKTKNTRKSSPTKISREKPNKKPLTEYQKFVKKESLKPKYKGKTPKERLRIIASVWKEKKNKLY